MPRKLIVVGCTATKEITAGEIEARDRYSGQLWHERREYAERNASDVGHWGIVSGMFGWLDPRDPIPWYGCKLGDNGTQHRRATLAKAVAGITARINHLDFDDEGRWVVEMHAGREYTRPIRAMLDALGIESTWPVEGLQIGQQLRWYQQQRKGQHAQAQ